MKQVPRNCRIITAIRGIIVYIRTIAAGRRGKREKFMIYQRIDELIGRTPLFRPARYMEQLGLECDLLLKLEYFNPAGSVKDRTARSILDDAEARGLLGRDTVIIEPTSGNTGIGLAALAAPRGYRVILTMPETMSVERRKLLAAYGAEIVLTDGAEGMKGAIAMAEKLHEKYADSIIAGQFVNPANPAAHYKTTGPEIWEDTDGKVDVLVVGAGTGGTVSGAGKFLKEKKPSVRVIAVEPAGSPVISGGKAGAHKLQGLGAGFIPDTLDTGVCDGVATVTDEDAFKHMRALAAREGIFVGISSGAALSAACSVAAKEEFKGKTIVAVLPDGGDRYLSLL